jgi:hexokinase
VPSVNSKFLAEEGKYLALDLGGTNFRTLLVEFEGGQLVREEVKFAEVPEAVRLGPGPGLFDYLAAFIHSFLGGLGLLDEQLPLGFTFSFPMDQKSLSSGLLVAWTKTFNCPGVVGRDAVEMLNEAIRRRGDLKVEVKALLNDTTGTLIQGAYLDRTTAIGLILGTGSNACYIESLHRVPHWHAHMSKTAKEVWTRMR